VGVTLVGFLRGSTMNFYAHAGCVIPTIDPPSNRAGA
jgi:hypothetical protein